MSIEELEKLPIGTMVTVKRGCFNVDYKIDTYLGKLCLSNFKLNTLYYEDILKLEVYEYTRETPVKYMDSFGATPYILTSNSDLAKKILDDLNNISWGITSENTIYKEYFDKPQSRITREFNIAKKKEFEVPKRTKEERLKYIIAHVEINVDKALESGNKDRFIMLTNKLKELKQACEVI